MAEMLNSPAIGIDVGATKIEGALVANDGQVLANRHLHSQTEQGIHVVLDQVARLINQLGVMAADNHQTRNLPLLGVGIGMPGQVNTKDGSVREAVNLGLDEINLVEEIRSRLQRELPIWIDTDTNASTLGEFFFGAARGCQNFVYISIGSGLGGGIVTNGKLLAGATWKAAELGHLSLDPDGELCICGLRGCAETIVSGPGLLRLIRKLQAEGAYTSRLYSGAALTTKTALSAAQDGDNLASAAFSEMGRHLGVTIAICASILNPALVVIGGGLGMAAFDLIIPAVWEELKRHILPAVYSNLKIVPSGQENSAVGAASMPLRLEPVVI